MYISVSKSFLFIQLPAVSKYFAVYVTILYWSDNASVTVVVELLIIRDRPIMLIILPIILCCTAQKVHLLCL